jgi:very-short-patch-repair endonuclease
MSDAVDDLVWQLRMTSVPAPKREYRFHPTRKWRFDLAWPEQLVAVEVDGGGFVEGRHGRGAGLRSDSEKFSEAAAMGWRVLRVVPDHVDSGQALAWVMRALDFHPLT